MINDCIIMAGGSGTRLWPASTSGRPKQFLCFPEDTSRADTRRHTDVQGAGARRHTGKSRTFFSAALERALAACAGDSRVVIVAGKDHIDSIIDECAELDAQERKHLVLIPEPLARNTAPAIACALLYIDWVSAGRERNILVLTSDHIIKPVNTFLTDVRAAAALAQADKLVVFGIPPERPETGYGYIETAEALTARPDKSVPKKRYEPEIFSVASFREKPDIKKARQFIAAKRFYWNSGMFAFSSKFMLDEFKRSANEVIAPFKKLLAPNEASYRTKKGVRILEEWGTIETAYRRTKAISFDYAIAEKCRSTVMVKAGFSWTDVGNWDEYARLPNHTKSEVYGTEGAGKTCFVNSDIPVALCGVEDLIVVIRAGKDLSAPVALISKKGETQRVKEIVEQIKAAGRAELL